MGTRLQHFVHPGLTAACLVAACLPVTWAGATVEGIKVIDHGGKIRWPTAMTALPDGRLMGLYCEGTKAFATYSPDNGYTWSDPHFLFDFGAGDGTYGPSSLLLDRDGVLHLFGLHYFGFSADDWQASKCLIYHVMSSDGGQTWGPLQYCDFKYHYGTTVSRAIQLTSGRILCALDAQTPRKTAKFVAIVTLSDDGGRTWRPSETECWVDTGGAEGESGAEEPCLLELQDGRVWMLIRTREGYQYESFSSDGGDTWAQPAPSRFVSSNAPAAILRLRDGRIVLVWQNCMGPRKPAQYERWVLAAAISDDDGKTWRGYREIARIESEGGVVTYPMLAEAPDGTVIASYGWDMKVVRIRPDWLAETTAREDFSQGAANWTTIGTEGVSVVAHPNRPGAQVLALRKPRADAPAGASYNFPFAVRGHLTMRVRPQPGFEGARICLTDFFSMPGTREDGRFGFDLAPDSTLTPGKAKLTPGEWHTLGFAWDCASGACKLTVDYKPIADLPQLSKAAAICYLRLWSAAEKTDDVGLLIESVSTKARP